MAVLRGLMGFMLSARGLVIGLALLLVWPNRPLLLQELIEDLERQWLSWSQPSGVSSQQSAGLSESLIFVGLTAEQMLALQDPLAVVNDPELMALINLEQTTLVLTPQPLVADSSIEPWLQSLQASQLLVEQEGFPEQLDDYMSGLNLYRRWLASPNVEQIVLAADQEAWVLESAANPRVLVGEQLQTLSQGLPHAFEAFNQRWLTWLNIAPPRYTNRAVALAQDYQKKPSLETSLYWRGDTALYATLPLVLAKKVQPDLQPIVSPQGDVLLSSSTQPASIYSLSMFHQAFSDSMLSRDSDVSPVIVVGLQGAPLFQRLAHDVPALISSAYYTQPVWFDLSQAILLICLVVILLVLAKYSSRWVLLLAACLLVMAIVSVQQFALLVHRQWLPVMDTVGFILVATLLLLAWAGQYRAMQQLIGQQQKNHWQLAQLWQGQGELDNALDSLNYCPVDDDRLQLSYDIAVTQEQRRQYQAAANTFSMIASHRRSFRDAAERAQQLLAVQSVQTSAGPAAGFMTMAQTMPVGQAALAKPVLGRYEIERELGRGAMGVVYLGNDPKIARQVAIKTLNYHAFQGDQLQELKERFFREAEAAGRLDHPNIVTVYDVGEETDLAYIAMDYVEGDAVSAFARPQHLLPVADVYRLIAAVADALDYAHQHHIVHRDIKPGNIMYNTHSKIVKVADFGIARITDDSRTKTGDVLGSPVYMSPEQMKGAKVSGATDIYSLGATFYQLLTGQLPFSSDSLANLAYQIVNKKPQSVRDIRKQLPASAVRLINKAMHKDPAKRFATAGDMAAAIRKSMARDFPREVA